MQAEVAEMVCASCGIAEVDEIKLTECNDCDLVRYCSDKCQKEHRPQHKATCKERAAELRDEILFRQPESTHLGDCPICFLPLPTDLKQYMAQSCCSKSICHGCVYANELREKEAHLQHTCPFCRHPTPTTEKEYDKNVMKRAEENDLISIEQVGKEHYQQGDYESAFEYWTKAAELGDAEAHYDLSILYVMGQGVEKDEKKELYHLEEAAIGGHPDARSKLGCIEWRNGRFDRAVKHWIIAANLGHDMSIQLLKDCYADGLLSKEAFAAALRAHHAAVDEMKSPQREAAAKADA
eukprot:scaffold9984_cov148-Skeletonema_dohrnii-CCMP3373.AAC.12